MGRVLGLSALLAALCAGAARAELSLQAVGWQAAQARPGRPAAWEDTARVQDGPPRLETRLRASARLVNRGPEPVEGILLRYSLSARLTRADGGASDPEWSIPLAMDTKRVPALGPNQRADVPLALPAGFRDQLARLARAGWWPDQVRVRVMIEPRAGDPSIRTAEGVLELAR